MTDHTRTVQTRTPKGTHTMTSTETLIQRHRGRDCREYETVEGDLVVARRLSTDRGEWLVTATANDANLTSVSGWVTRNVAGFRGRDWESGIDGQQHPSLIEAMRGAVSLARQRADISAFLPLRRRAVGTETTTRHDVRLAEDAARAHLLDVRHPEREGWTCIDCPDANGYADPPEPGTWLWREEDGAASPLCNWHAQERIHDTLPYGANCTGCGKDHSALWPTGEPLFDREPDR